MLHMKYYKEYGLAIEGLTRHHKIDPLEFNREVDDALPLDDILKPDPKLRRLLEDIDRSKVRMWLLTNAYVTHAKRVVKLLQVDDLFEGITYCDYGNSPLVCKPSQAMYERAEKEAGASSTSECYFVGKSPSQFLSHSTYPDQVLTDRSRRLRPELYSCCRPGLGCGSSCRAWNTPPPRAGLAIYDTKPGGTQDLFPHLIQDEAGSIDSITLCDR